MIVVLSQGCAANFGEGEKIARALARNHDVTFQFPEPAEANPSTMFGSTGHSSRPAIPEAFYLNVCTVKGNAGALKLLRKVRETYPESAIYITGCTPKDFIEEATRIAPQIHWTHLHAIEIASGSESADITACATSDAEVEDASRVNRTGILRESPFVGIVNIEEGCLDACAFCSTHLVKGRLHSFPPDWIVDRVHELVDDGCLEIQLTGQDCACYGFDCGTNLAELVQKILVKVSGDYRIRLGMGNPRHVLQYEDALLDCFTDNRMYQFIHLPVQSGSDRVLQFMNRRHSVQDYRQLAQAFVQRFPRFALSTDLIVGHPGETPEDFEATLRLLEETRPTVANITRFVARPGTVAARISDSALLVPDSLKHERSAKLAEAFQRIALENHREWIGTHEAVITEKNGYRPGTTIARNSAYRPVALQGTYPAGRALNVRIVDAEAFALIGEVLP